MKMKRVLLSSHQSQYWSLLIAILLGPYHLGLVPQPSFKRMMSFWESTHQRKVCGSDWAYNSYFMNIITHVHVLYMYTYMHINGMNNPHVHVHVVLTIEGLMYMYIYNKPCIIFLNFLLLLMQYISFILCTLCSCMLYRCSWGSV